MAIVVAMANDRVIGVENALPWHLPEDLKRFKSVTMGHPMIMGRLTFESIGRPLPGRVTIVVTRDVNWGAPEGVLVANDLNQAQIIAEQQALQLGVERIMVVGGAKVYAQLIDKCNCLYVTEVHTSVAGDAFFPNISDIDWSEVSRVRHQSMAADELSYSFIEYHKVHDD